MLFHGQESQTSHMYSSGPLEWPSLTRGIAYWVASDSNAQKKVWYYQSNNLVLCIRLIIIILWLALIIFVFQKFAILSYGMTPLTAKDLMKLRWSETWDFIVHKL
ncbi:hypothetical protein G9C98_004916 [Cotesia typhae]|uniref:Uncharacterized protein n=1 Tax=Cotesia typhae TaxID=2053667 RepID=A0A8J5R5B4_9HYME|nr:hypothetical protein G9C98_004916 [Cotesia typhae]